MAIGDTPTKNDQQWLTRLILAHNAEQPELRRLLEYYEGLSR
ncbi:hypothetical protein [Saccharopolyspora phatthalungensis]|uniref:Uncharacterized protein n=1 Tax=Saccharopolyspora phatthalungensis TaxID=664693 RepID=A0A840Q9F4_9PSEU|nr:hypothetical protein [Saccharopolyspora phatthalungensis]MBB5156470.1 hypothetical protein [Saccharopolyspora phatthalungensis]